LSSSSKAYEKERKNDDELGAYCRLHLVKQNTRRRQQVGGSSLSSSATKKKN